MACAERGQGNEATSQHYGRARGSVYISNGRGGVRGGKMERESAGGEHNEGLPGYVRRASFDDADATDNDAAGTKKRLRSGTISPQQRPAAKKLVFSEDNKELEAEQAIVDAIRADAEKALEKRISDFRALVEESKKENSNNSGKNDDHDIKGFTTIISDSNTKMSNDSGGLDTEGFATVNSGSKNSVSNEGQESGRQYQTGKRRTAWR